MKRPWKKSRLASSVNGEGLFLEQADIRLLVALDREFAESARKAGPLLACGPGCSDCCIGPFPITRLDVWRLQRGMERLGEEAPELAMAVALRARRSAETLANGYPGDPVTGLLNAGEELLDRYFERHGDLACPALDPSSGRCDLHDWRPVSCRTYGPPVRFGPEEVAPPCRLCFQGATAGVVERCRMEPDRQGLEETILAGLGVREGEDWETLIAFALARESIDVAQ